MHNHVFTLKKNTKNNSKPKIRKHVWTSRVSFKRPIGGLNIALENIQIFSLGYVWSQKRIRKKIYIKKNDFLIFGCIIINIKENQI